MTIIGLYTIDYIFINILYCYLFRIIGMMVNWYDANLPGPCSTQIFGQTLFLVCLWECFCVRLTFELVDYKVDWPP